MATLQGGLDTSYKIDMQTIAFVNTEQVTPSDTDRYSKPCYLRCGGAGTLAYINQAGETVNYGTVAAGERVIALASGVLATGTTATAITRHW